MDREEGRRCIQKSFAGDLYVADGSEWKLFSISRGVCAPSVCVCVCVFGLYIVKLSLLAQQPSTIRQAIIVRIGGGRAWLSDGNPSPFFFSLSLFRARFPSKYSSKGYSWRDLNFFPLTWGALLIKSPADSFRPPFLIRTRGSQSKRGNVGRDLWIKGKNKQEK